MQLSEISRELESLGKENRIQDASLLLDQLDEKFQVTLVALDSELETAEAALA